MVEAEDIVQVLAKVASEDFKYEKTVDGNKVSVPFDCVKAHAVAIAILKDQADEDASASSFSFMDYMRTQDNGTIPFPSFLSKVTIPTEGRWAPSAEQTARVQEAWNSGIQPRGRKQVEKAGRRTSEKGSRPTPPQATSSTNVDIVLSKSA